MCAYCEIKPGGGIAVTFLVIGLLDEARGGGMGGLPGVLLGAALVWQLKGGSPFLVPNHHRKPPNPPPPPHPHSSHPGFYPDSVVWLLVGRAFLFFFLFSCCLKALFATGWGWGGM